MTFNSDDQRESYTHLDNLIDCYFALNASLSTELCSRTTAGLRTFDEPRYFHINAHHCQLSAEISRIICSPTRNGADSTRGDTDVKRGSNKTKGRKSERLVDSWLLLEFHKGPLSCNRYQLWTQTTSKVLIFFPVQWTSLARFTFTPFKLSRLYLLVAATRFLHRLLFKRYFSRYYF